MTSPPWYRPVVWALAFVAVVLVGDRVGAAVLEAAVMRTGNRYAALYRGGLDKDVVVIGNSRGINSFHQPSLQEELDRPVFNLSFNGMPTELQEVILYDYFDRNERPELVVIEVTGSMADDDKLADFFMFADHSDRLADFLYGTVPRKEALVRKTFALHNFDTEMLTRALSYVGRSDQSVINRYSILPSMLELVEREPPVEFTSRPENLRALRRMVDFCEARGVAVRLIVGPYLPQYLDKVTNYDAWFASVQAAVGEDVEIWDYSDRIDDLTGFSDRIHLNLEGSKMLIPYLLEDRFFEPAGAAATAASLASDRADG